MEISPSSGMHVYTAQLQMVYTQPPSGLFSFLKKPTVKAFVLNPETFTFRANNFQSSIVSIKGMYDKVLHDFQLNLKEKNVISKDIYKGVLDVNNLVFGISHQREYSLLLQIRKPDQQIELLWIDVGSLRFVHNRVKGTILYYQTKTSRSGWVSCIENHSFVIEKIGKDWFLSVM